MGGDCLLSHRQGQETAHRKKKHGRESAPERSKGAAHTGPQARAPTPLWRPLDGRQAWDGQHGTGLLEDGVTGSAVRGTAGISPVGTESGQRTPMSADTHRVGGWRIELLGGLRIRRGDEEIAELQRQKPALLLACLAYHLRHPRPRETLIELLWPEGDQETGRNNLRFVLHSLRRLLEPPDIPPGTLLVADGATVCLDPTAVTTDVVEFEAAVQAAAQTADPRQRAHFLSTA